tara:strand:+ start:631 stop:2151 length:1521 start_codon:yes stop_codon:yes gene_type:complete
MSLKRYYASKDNTITNAYKDSLTTRGVSGNMGQSDILETFSIYGQVSSSTGLSSELSRILIQFSTSEISTDRTAGTIPASGSVSFFLTLYDAEHTQTTPDDFTMVVSAISQSWDEGLGLDMENYTDLDSSNWLSSSGATRWVDDNSNILEGGSYKTGSNASPLEYHFTQSFDTGFENLEIDVSHLVEDWIKGQAGGGLENYGFGVHLTSSDETANNSYYTKMFFARGSQFWHKRPIVEARWDSSKKDNRGDFYLSSSLVPAADNLMNLYLYNIVRGNLTDIPAVGTGEILVSIYSGSEAGAPTGAKLFSPLGGGVVATGDVNITGSWVETGIYSASFAYVSSSITKIFDVWHSGSGGGDSSVQYHTGSKITPKTFDSQNYNFDQKYVSKVTNMRSTYDKNETARFRLYVRQKDWSPTIYNVSSNAIETSIIEDAYYKVTRVSDGLDVIPYGTGSLNHTRLSYDVSGSYFDLKMNLFDTDSIYEMKFTYVINGNYVDQSESFRFRVE